MVSGKNSCESFQQWVVKDYKKLHVDYDESQHSNVLELSSPKWSVLDLAFWFTVLAREAIE